MGAAWSAHKPGNRLYRIIQELNKDKGAWVAQWVKASAFGSGHDPRVLGKSPASDSLLNGEPASFPLPACLSAYL